MVTKKERERDNRIKRERKKGKSVSQWSGHWTLRYQLSTAVVV